MEKLDGAGLLPGSFCMVQRMPPKARPVPRDYRIFHSIHSDMRGASTRAISREMAEDTIRTGRARYTGDDGTHGGDVFEFSKTHYVPDGAGRRQRRVVAFCEILGDDCRVITLFNES
jgi:hypothetical protein